MRPATGTVRPIPSQHSDSSTRSVELDELFRREFAFVWRVLRRFGLSEPEAEDGAQDVFLIVAHKLASYEERGSMREWLFSVARLVARQMRRADARRLRRHLSIEPPAPHPDPQQLAECQELATLVQRFLDRLDEDQAMVFYLSEVEGLSAPEIATALQLRVTTVIGRRRLSRKRFEAFLQRHPGGPGE